MEVGASQHGLDYRVVNKISYFIGGLFQRRANLDAQEQWAGLARGKDEPFTKKLYAWEVTAPRHLPG